MRAYHNSRDLTYRSPFGAAPVGEGVSLSIDIHDANVASCTLRLWEDGVGETLVPMERREGGFFCVFTPEKPALYWYSFIIAFPDGGSCRYGAREGRSGGEGALYGWEPPSYQLTVYEPRSVPAWYKNAIVYQIFPDRFNRGRDWEALARPAASAKRNGPGKVIVEDWGKTPSYDKDERGRIRNWDFYGGTLSGIEEKLDYLKELGITALYLNPIFEAASNHRYDTGDYTRVDPMLGGDEAFERLAKAAGERGISIILDGVFNHTGCDSRYFNKYGNYPTTGAYQSEASPYRDWFRFDGSPAGYECWWGVDDLPNVEENNAAYREFIYGGENAVVRKWLKAGAKGWRLDVADELPDDFIEGIKTAVTETLGDEGLLLGEVWEDASNKISYGVRRKYFQGRELDAVMNYPLADALLGFLRQQVSAADVAERLRVLKENYPREALYASLNLMGSHDRPRILTLLGNAPDPGSMSERERRDYRLSDSQRGLAKGRMWLLNLLQMTMPGVPCIYYGDEAGLEGFADPYNRAAYPWGEEDPDTAVMYRNAIAIRRLFPAFVDGEFEPFSIGDDVFGFYRDKGEEHLAVLVNRGFENRTVTVDARGEACTELIGGMKVELIDGKASLTLWPLGSAVLHFHEKDRLGAKMPRGSGVLCHITSLPNEKGPGNIGEPARRFVDHLAAAGQKYWQILPVNPTDEFGSPYAGASAFAANVNLLPQSEEELREAFKTFVPDAAYGEFIARNAGWLDPYAAFAALKKRFNGAHLREWPEQYRKYDPSFSRDPAICPEAEFQRFCQYKFDVLWQHLRAYAKSKGVMIIGDLPMFVSDDSADVWVEPEEFRLSPDGTKTDVAGVPPDYFAKDGQLWGNPLYDWEHMAGNGYRWWLRRLRRCFDLYDFTRLDHFRGFESYWATPAGRSARDGRWLPGPGVKLFEAAFAEFGSLPVLAEDLGSITPAVRALLSQCGFYGTDVLQFQNEDPVEGDYVPPEGKIAYTGTHDNQTLIGWCMERHSELDPIETARELREKVMKSRADIVIQPLQDVLELGDEARMNTPGVSGGQWAWQARSENFEDAFARLLKLTKKSDRS